MDRGAAGGDAEQVHAQHAGEGIGRVLHEHADQTEPDDFVGDCQEARHQRKRVRRPPGQAGDGRPLEPAVVGTARGFRVGRRPGCRRPGAEQRGRDGEIDQGGQEDAAAKADDRHQHEPRREAAKAGADRVREREPADAEQVVVVLGTRRSRGPAAPGPSGPSVSAGRRTAWRTRAPAARRP